MYMEVLIRYLIRLLIVAGSISVIWLTFSRLRERSLALRGLLALGFLGLYSSTVAFLLSELSVTPMILGASWLPFAVVAVVEAWGKNEGANNGMNAAHGKTESKVR